MYDVPSERTAKLEALKRNLYAIATTIAGLAALFAYVVDDAFPGSPVVRFVFGPAVALAALVLAFVFRMASIDLRKLEAGVYLGAGTVFVLRIAAQLWLFPVGGTIREVLADFEPWNATLFVFAFMALDTRTAVPAALALYAAEVALLGSYTLMRDPTTVSAADWNALVQGFGVSNAVMIALLYFLARTKEALARERTERNLYARIAHTDELTGIANRRQILAACQKELDRNARASRTFSVVLFDVDHFKRINDTLGHATGDAVLRRIVEIVGGSLRSGDDFGRFGGEEFLVLAYGADASTAVGLAERLRAALETDRAPGLPEVTASFGVATLRPDDTLTSLLARADHALYVSKHRGRNRVSSETPIPASDVVPSVAH